MLYKSTVLLNALVRQQVNEGQLSLAILKCVGTMSSNYQPKGGDALQLGSKGGYSSCVGGWHIKLCDPLADTGHI